MNNIPVGHPLFAATKGYNIIEFGHMKLIKDSNDNEKKENKDLKKTVSSKLPWSVRSNTSSTKTKSSRQTHLISRNAAGTSRQIFSAQRTKTDTSGGEEKSKPSQIPRRRFAKELPTKELSLRTVNKNKINRQKTLVEPRNIQRVQLLNVNPDFCPEPPKAVTIARPIPTLGQIYRQNLSNESLTDWYLESVSEYIETPQGSTASNTTENTALFTSSYTSKNKEDSSANEPNNLKTEDTNATANPKTLNVTAPLKIFNTTDENVSAWMSLELDHPTKDDESGYGSMSPGRKAVLSTKANNSIILRIPHDKEEFMFDNTIKKSVSATVIIKEGNSDIHKLLKYPSTPNPSRKRENFEVPVPSYVEYPSEVIQKTTNFETEAGAGPAYDCDPSKCTLELVDEYSDPIDDMLCSQSPQESTYCSSLQSPKYSYFTQEPRRENYIDDKNEMNQTKCSGTDAVAKELKSAEFTSSLNAWAARASCKTETQVSPVPSIGKVSTVTLAQEQNKDVKLTVVTEMTLPCRRFENTLVTSKGTILSCTGTKVTSVTASESSKTSRANVVNTGTDELLAMKSEKSTSCAVFKTFADAAVSHPECLSISINTDVELRSKSTGTETSFHNRNKSTNDCHAQYSEPLYRKSYGTSDNSSYLAHIGRSRLISARMLSNSVADMATQAQPVFQCAETNTAFKEKKSVSVLTSRYAISETLQSMYKLLQPKHTGSCLTCHSADMGCDYKTFIGRERGSQAFAPVRNDVACKTNSELKSVTRQMTRNAPESNQQAPNAAEPNFVISSNLNATKWMKGCTKESEKDVQSIISISETMIAESLERAFLLIASSKGRQSISVKDLAEVLINNQPDVSCVMATGYHPSSSFSVTRLLPTKDENIVQEEKPPSSIQSENDVKTVNKMTSGTGLNVTSKQQSASVLTSRHILSNPPKCFHTCEDINRDCIFVYDRPRCVVHSFLADAVVQTELQQRNSEIPIKKHGSMSSRSVGLATSFGRRTSCSHQKNINVGEVLSPKVYKALYETTKLLTKEGSESTTPTSSKTGKQGYETTTTKSSKTGKEGYKIITPKSSKTEKQGYETTSVKSSKTGKEGYEIITPKSSKTEKQGYETTSAKSSKTGKEGYEIITPKSSKTEKQGYETTSAKSSTTGKEGYETTTPKSSETGKGYKNTTEKMSFTPPICKTTGKLNNKSIQTVAEPLLFCPHCNARLSQTHDLDRESMKNQSIQAVGGSFLNCPQCRAKVAVLSNDSRHESAEECMQSYLMASCRYYSNLLTIKLAQVKENFQKHIAPSIEEVLYHVATIPNNFHHTPSNNNIIYTEACTMKPSGRKDENCEAKFYTTELNNRAILYQATSLTDVRGDEKNDLKNVYCILTAIEGRVRRLKSNLTG